MIRRICLAFALLLCAFGAHAHKASDAYVQIDAARSRGVLVRWDIALRDLDVAIGLDGNDDGRLTWGEIKAAWPRIEAYALPRLAIDGCPLKLTSTALERRSDGAYAVLNLASDCAFAPTPAVRYALLREVDPTHRGILRVARMGEPAVVSMLTPDDMMPATTSAAERPGFVAEGVLHILGGYDHVLFLLCLLLPSVMQRTPEQLSPGRPKTVACPPGGPSRSDAGAKI